jgi:hypothetical protein
MEKDAENYSNINMFSSKINICSNKPITAIQKFRCTLTNLNTADEVTRIDGKCEIKSNEIRERTLLRRFAGHNSKKNTTF